MKKIEEMTLQEKIGQLFMIGLQKEEEIEDLINNEKIGGIILYRKNYDDYKQMVQLVNNIKNVNKNNSVPIFISIDQEGGRVNRMPKEIENIRNATALANTNNIEIVKQSGKIIAEMLKQTGISVNYAPILDIKRFEENHPIGNRCYGEDKDSVSKYGIAVMKEIKENGVIPVIKHFPGHGSTQKDSHFRIPKIKRSVEEIEREDMIPFENAIKNGADAIMLGHLLIDGMDKKYPASLSKEIIQKYLIDKYQFKGLIITDDLKMFAIQLHYNIKKATLKAIEAGNDIVMLGFSYKKIKKIIKYITKEVEKGNISIDRINESVNKIIKMKEKYNVTDEQVTGFDIEKINEQIRQLDSMIEK